jgi:hypothetical protein
MEDKHAREIQALQDENIDLLQKLSDGTVERVQTMEGEIQAMQSNLPSRTAQTTEVSTTSAETHTADVVQVRKSDDPLTHRINTKNIRTFNGEAEDWEDYEPVLHIALENRRVPKQLYGNYLAELLVGKAAKILPEIDESKRCDYECLTTALKRRNSPEAFQELHRLLLKNRKQKPGESYRDLATDLAKHSRTVYSHSGASELEANEAFRKAVTDDHVRFALLHQQYKSLEDAIAYAELIHTTWHGIAPPGYNYPHDGTISTHSDGSSEDSLPIEYRSRQLDPDCKGHRRSHCRMRRRRGKKPLKPMDSRISTREVQLHSKLPP